MAKRKHPKVWTVPGPGRKMCPGCKVYIASRTKKCKICGTTFSVKSSTYRSVFTEPPVVVSVDPSPYPEICIPAGLPPCDLSGTSEAAVQIWMQDLSAVRPGMRLAPSAYKYWARTFYEINSAEYETVCRHIDNYAEHLRKRK